MKKNSIIILAIIVVLLIPIVLLFKYIGSSKEDLVTEKIIKWNIGSEPKTLDPQLNTTLSGGSVINNMYEGLFRIKDYKLEPALTQSYEISEDGLVYTFKLKDTLWSDGSKLTAFDFEYAWKRALDPHVASQYAFQLYYIKGGQAFNEGIGRREEVMVTALDNLTLEVTLEAPTAYFLDLLTSFTYMPTKQTLTEASPDGSWAIDPDKCISNGPFVLTQYKMGDQLVLSKNLSYWNAENVKVSKIIASMIVDESTILTAYESGEFDIIDEMPLAEIPKLQAEESTLKSNLSIGTYFYAFNTQVEPLDNLLVRKALSMAIDRKLLVEVIMKGGEVPASGLTPPGLFDVNGDDFRDKAGNYGIPIDKVDIETAKLLLAEAGYPGGIGFPTIEILYNTSESHQMIAEAIQEMWKKNLNINMRLNSQEGIVFQESKKLGKYMIARGSWFGDYADPMSMLEPWTSYSTINTTGWKSETYDALIGKAKVETGQARFDLLYQAESLLMNDVPILPLFYYSDLFLISDRILGWEKSVMGIWYFGNTDIKEME